MEKALYHYELPFLQLVFKDHQIIVLLAPFQVKNNDYKASDSCSIPFQCHVKYTSYNNLHPLHPHLANPLPLV